METSPCGVFGSGKISRPRRPAAGRGEHAARWAICRREVRPPRPQTGLSSPGMPSPDHPDRPDQDPDRPVARAAPHGHTQAMARPARPRGKKNRARLHKNRTVPIAACGIETCYCPIPISIPRNQIMGQYDGSAKSREAGIREWQVELCNRQHGKGDGLRCISLNCDSNCARNTRLIGRCHAMIVGVLRLQS